MPTAWVTGARGFIGSKLARALSQHDLRVHGIGHGHLPEQSWSACGLSSWLNSQISPEALGQLAARDGVPDFVFHLAGGSTVGASLLAPLEDFTRTTATTATLLEWLRNHSPATQLVVASSAAVYGDTRGEPAEESRPCLPVSPYGWHKWMMEQLCREYSQVFGLRCAILRLFSVYGEGLRKQLLWDCSLKLLAQGERIELGGTGEERRDWVYIDDAVSMLQRVAALADRECPVFNGGSGVGVSVREVVGLLAAALNRPKRVEFSGVRRPGDPASLIAHVGRLSAAGHTSQT